LRGVTEKNKHEREEIRVTDSLYRVRHQIQIP
jgi:hypothetical protein